MGPAWSPCTTPIASGGSSRTRRPPKPADRAGLWATRRAFVLRAPIIPNGTGSVIVLPKRRASRAGGPLRRVAAGEVRRKIRITIGRQSPMGQSQLEREEHLTARALFMAIRIYDLYPDEMRPDADRADMIRIIHEQFPHYAHLLAEPNPGVMAV